jgi:lipopolysaccharide transport system ATP-binding protein
MSYAVITVENLSKRYLVGHRSGEEGSYKTLRDVVAREAHNFARKAVDVFRGRQVVQGDEIEEFWALKNVNFEIKQGEVTGIIGRNGAGKSTLLKILSRVTEPTLGRVVLRGRVASLLEVGTGFHPELTGRENIFLNGAVLGMTRREIRKKFDEIVAFADVERFLDTPVKRYSSGMYVRLAFAVAAHLDSEILVVDEVLAVGDAEFQKKCLGRMEEITGGGRTVLFVSHNMNVVSKLCKSIIVLSEGRTNGITPCVIESISDYLSPERSQKQTSWENVNEEIESEYITPIKFFARQGERPSETSEFRNDCRISIFVEGIIHKSNSALNAGIAVYAIDGTLLFWSLTTDTPAPFWVSLNPGRFVLTCDIPPHFLNEGTYVVEFIASLHYQAWLLAPGSKVPRLQISIRDGLSDSPIWSERRPGLLAPILKWSRIK